MDIMEQSLAVNLPVRMNNCMDAEAVANAKHELLPLQENCTQRDISVARSKNTFPKVMTMITVWLQTSNAFLESTRAPHNAHVTLVLDKKYLCFYKRSSFRACESTSCTE